MRKWIILGALVASATAAFGADLRYGYGDPPPPPHYRPVAPDYDRSAEPDDERPPLPEYGGPPRPRIYGAAPPRRCWVQPGPWGPERVCRADASED